MTHHRARLAIAVAISIAASTWLAACSREPDTTAASAPAAVATTHVEQAPGTASTAASSAFTPDRATASTAQFAPPPESAIPDTPFGDMIREGQTLFTHTREHAGKYVGNGLSCDNCHLDAGRLAHSAPLWAAWGMYPAYRKKNGHVNTYAERLQGCFRFSMNGKAPPATGRVIRALEAYSYWLAKGAPTGVALPGRGFADLPAPTRPPDYARGRKIFRHDCALCHGAEGQGQKVAGNYVFPPLWGPESFNWGAGMGRINTAAAFIKANMPLGRGGMLSAQEAWDVARFMDAHERPQDPRFTGNVAETRRKFHDTPMSLYGKRVDGHVLGSGSRSTH